MPSARNHGSLRAFLQTCDTGDVPARPSSRIPDVFIIGSLGFLLTAFLQKRHIFETSTQFLAGTFTEAGAVALYLSDIFFLLVLAMWLWRKRWRSSLPWHVVAPLAFLVAWAGLRAVTSSFPLLGIYHAGRILQAALLFLIVADTVRHREGARFFLICLMLLGILQSLLGGYQVFAGTSLGLSSLGEPVLRVDLPGVAKVDLAHGEKLVRAYGTLPHPNVLGGLLLITLLASGALGARSMLPSPLVYACVGIQCGGLLLTFSRTAIGGAILTIVYICFLVYIRRTSFLRPLKLFFVVLLAALILVFSWSTAREALVNRVFPPPGDQFLSERVRTLEISWEIARRHLFFGVGPGNFIPELLQQVPSGTAILPWQYDYPHMVPVVILVELGLVGGLLFLLFLARIGKQAYRTPFTGVLLVPLILPFVLDHYLWTLQPGRILLWSVLGVVAGLTFPVRSGTDRQPNAR